MADPQPALLPPALREACLFPPALRIAEEDLAGNRKDPRIAEPLEERRQEIRRNPHVAVQQNHHIVLRGLDAGIRAATKAEVPLEHHHPHLGEALADEIGAAVGRAIVDHDDLVPWVVLGRRDDGRQVLLQ
jgi:hypothetical protein